MREEKQIGNYGYAFFAGRADLNRCTQKRGPRPLKKAKRVPRPLKKARRRPICSLHKKSQFLAPTKRSYDAFSRSSRTQIVTTQCQLKRTVGLHNYPRNAYEPSKLLFQSCGQHHYNKSAVHSFHFSIGFVNKILSARFWIPLSRLTYCTYLVHIIAINTLSGSFKTMITYNDIHMVSQCCVQS